MSMNLANLINDGKLKVRVPNQAAPDVSIRLCLAVWKWKRAKAQQSQGDARQPRARLTMSIEKFHGRDPCVDSYWYFHDFDEFA